MATFKSQSIWTGESELAFAAGVNVMFRPEPTIGFSKASPSRVFGPLDVAREPLPPSRLAEQMANRSRRGSPLSAVIGDPVAAREAVSRFRDTGVDELMLVMQWAPCPTK